MPPVLAINDTSPPPRGQGTSSVPLPARGRRPAATQLTRMGNVHADSIAPLRAARCARRIQAAWKDFQQHVRTTAVRCADADRVRLTYRGDHVERFPERALRCGREFYPSLTQGAPLRYPQWDPATGHEAFGRFKSCFSDRHFVALQPTPGAPRFAPCRLGPYRSLLEPFSSLVFNTLIDDTLMIAPNAGVDLFDYVDAGKLLTLDAFAGICADMTRLHAMKARGGAYLRDIKPENVCVSPGAPQRLRLIDFQDSLVFGDELPHLHMAHRRGTDVYQTPGLVWGLYAGEAEARSRYAMAADAYALVLSIITGTTGDPWLRFEAGCNGRHQMQEAGLTLPPGVMHAGNDLHFTPWIARHVYPAYWNDIRLLLTDPARFATERQTQATLLQMLRFRA